MSNLIKFSAALEVAARAAGAPVGGEWSSQELIPLARQAGLNVLFNRTPYDAKSERKGLICFVAVGEHLEKNKNRDYDRGFDAFGMWSQHTIGYHWTPSVENGRLRYEPGLSCSEWYSSSDGQPAERAYKRVLSVAGHKEVMIRLSEPVVILPRSPWGETLAYNEDRWPAAYVYEVVQACLLSEVEGLIRPYIETLEALKG